MLSLASTVYAKGVPGPFGQPTDYILYSDTKEPNVFYVLPEMPTLMPMSNGDPSFNIIWFYGSGVQDGGLCTFTVALPLPNVSQRAVYDKLTQAVRQDPAAVSLAQNKFRLAQAFNTNNTVDVEAALKVLGINENAGRTLVKSFDPQQDYAQFLPPEKLTFQAVPMNKGQVKVRGFGPGNYTTAGPAVPAGSSGSTASSAATSTPPVFEGVYSATPSLVMNNAAVVTFSLNGQGANLFWQGLGGPKPDGAPISAEYANSVVSVEYEVEFDGMLPGAEAKVTLHRENVARVLTATKTARASWGRSRTWEEVVGKDYKREVQDSIKIETPSSAYTVAPEGKASIRDMLHEWATEQLGLMVEAQLPDIKLSELATDKADSLSVIQNDTRTYSLSTGIAIKKNPQSQLPKVNGLPLKASLDTFFTEIDLNQKPFFNTNVVVNPPARTRLLANSIDSVVVTRLNFGTLRLRDKARPSQEVSMLSFVSKDGLVASNTSAASTSAAAATRDGVFPQSQLVGTFSKKNAKDVVSYDYAVSYTDGTPTYQIRDQKLGTNEFYLDLNALDLGILEAKIDASHLPWGIVTSAILEAKYADLYQNRFTLTQAQPLVRINKPLGRKVDQKLQYRLTVNLSNGRRRSFPQAEGTYAEAALGIGDTIYPTSPLGDFGAIEADFKLDSDVTSAVSRVSYALMLPDGTSITLDKKIALDARKSTDKWRVARPAVDGATTFTFKTVTVTRNGTKHKWAQEPPIDVESSDPEFTFGIDELSVV
ncbi:MAG TPA: hypothetical protein VGJ60_11525 [Chloroflexota bacterium]